MIITRILGTVVSTQKDERLHGKKLLIVKPVNLDGTDQSGYLVSVDTVGAGFHEKVIVVGGSSARLAEGNKDCPVDSAIIGVIDEILFNKEVKGMRNKLKLTFIFIGLSVLLAAASANAQSIGDRNHMQGTGGYRITGKVYLPDGRPAPNVTVTVNSAETSNLTSRTNQDGSFEVPGLGAGNYNVSVREAAYKPENESITIAGGTRGQAYPIIFHLTLTGDAKAAQQIHIYDCPKRCHR